MKTERDRALSILTTWALNGSPPESSAEWSEADGLTREIVWTSIRHCGQIDAWIDRLSRKPPNPYTRAVLWVGFTQLLLLDGIADHAAVYETLEAAKRSGLSANQRGFANALLRRTIREKDDYPGWVDSLVPEERYSCPTDLYRRWMNAFGFDTANELCEWNQQRAGTFARLTEKGKALGSAHQMPAGCTPWSDTGNIYRLPRGLKPDTLPDFEQGAWYIQDPATLVAPRLLDVQPGEQVVDVCAAPGGKTALLAEALGSEAGNLVACEPNPKRMKRLKENLARLGHDKVTTRMISADQLEGEFNAALLDVPCTNTGVLQRRPDAKWSFDLEKLNHLTALQSDLLTATAGCIVPGGRMVYSTCSIEPEETTEQVRSWLEKHSFWSLQEEQLLLPGSKQCDGAYAARLERATEL